MTLRRLSEFATDTDPLVTQLRPAARELSPTLEDLGAMAPDLEALFRELNPLIDASKAGFPAAERILRDLRPLLAQIDPAAQQLVPLLDYVGLYRPELNAFWANVSGGHPGARPRQQGALPAHDEPVQPGEPGGVSTPDRLQPAEPVHPAGGLPQARQGLDVVREPPLQPRGAGGGQRAAAGRISDVPVPTPTAVPDLPLPVPTVVPTPTPPPTPTTEELQALIPTELLQRINTFAFSQSPVGGPVPAPPCRQQAPIDYAGERTLYPHVKAGTGR